MAIKQIPYEPIDNEFGELFMPPEPWPKDDEEDDDDEPIELGSATSGNYGHEGRPGEVGGSGPGKGAFAESNRREYQKLAVQDRLKKLVDGAVVIRTADPHLIRTGEQVEAVLKAMKADGLEMPHSILIDHTEPGEKLTARISGYVIRDAAGAVEAEHKDLIVEIPADLPPDADLDKVVSATFGAQSQVSPKFAYGDTEYQTYDRFTARTLEDIVVHEMGHVQAGHRTEPLPIAAMLSSNLFGSTDAIRRAQMRVSEYALSNPNEFLAESFTRLRRGETLAEDSMKLYRALSGPEVKPKKKDLRHDLGSASSGNYGHAGRPGQVGGSAPGDGGEVGDRSGGAHGMGHLVKSLLNEAEMRNIEGAGPAHHRYVDLEFEVEEKRESVEYTKSLLEKFEDDEDNPDRPAALERWKHAMDVLKETEKARDVQQQRGRNEIISNLANAVAKEMGIEPRFNVVHEAPKGFKVGEKQFNEAGFYNPNTNMIKLNAATIDAYNADEVKGIAAHEIMHQIQNSMEDDDDVVLTRGPDGKMVATLRPSPLIAMVTPEMIKENGHSAYAKTYWDPAVVAKKGNLNAIKETMAEVARYLISPKSWDEEGHPAPNSAWVTMVKTAIADAKESRESNARFEETMRKHREAHP